MERTIKILFLAANPKDTIPLRLDEEIRAIDQALRQAEFRDRFDIKQHFAVRVDDLQALFLRHKPDIVHFSGHGSPKNEIILEDQDGNSKLLSNRALSQLFSVLKDNIRCVVLNACYSEPQAQAIAEHIGCVVGMSKAIGDIAAIRFSAAFYEGLGFGRDVRTAFDLGCLKIDLENLNEQDTPKLLALHRNPREIIFVDNEAKIESHTLHQFPRGPLVEYQWIKDELVWAYANSLDDPFKAKKILTKAVQLRLEADPNATYIHSGDLPLLANIGPYAYWQAAFHEACRNGPRMLAALLLAQPDDFFEPAARTQRTKLLQRLRDMKRA